MPADIPSLLSTKNDIIKAIREQSHIKHTDTAIYSDYMLQRWYKFYAHFVPCLEAIWVTTNGRTRWIAFSIWPKTYTEVWEGKWKIVKETHARDMEPTPDLIDVNPTNSSMEWGIPRRIQELLSLPHSPEDSI